MTAADHVKMLYVFSERNPVSNVVRFHLGPARAWRACRPASASPPPSASRRSPRMSDGSLWSGAADVIVTQAACLDET